MLANFSRKLWFLSQSALSASACATVDDAGLDERVEHMASLCFLASGDQWDACWKKPPGSDQIPLPHP
jgi:hypothetical protein